MQQIKRLCPTIVVLPAFGLLALLCSACSPRASEGKHLSAANQFFDSGQYDRAEIEYKNVVQLDPSNPQAIARLGIIYDDEGSLDKAIPFLRKGLELDPNNLQIHLKLSQIYLSTRNPKEARDQAGWVLDRNPLDPDAPILLAEATTNGKDVEDARQRIQALPSSAVAGAPVIVALGLLDMRHQDSKGAEEAFRRALIVDPKSSAADFYLGVLLWSEKDTLHADKAFAEAASLSPLRSSRRLQYAQYKVHTGDNDSASRLLNQMVAEAPDYLPAWLLLAEIDANQKKYDESESMLAKVIARDQANPEALMLSARLKIAKGENEKAMAVLELLQRLYPKSSQADFQLGQLYLSIGDTGKAIGSLNRAIAITPGFTEAIVLLAEADIRRGDYRSAYISLNQLVQKKPDFIQGLLLLADSERGLGNLDDALAVYRKIDTLHPNKAETQLLSGLVLVAQNKRDEARASFNRAIELSPTYEAAAEQLINLDLMEKENSAAVDRASRWVKESPDLGWPRLLQARAYLAQNETEKGEAALKKTIELQPDNRAAYFLLAQLYLTTNRQQKALSDLEGMSAKNPRDLGVLMMMGTIYNQQKNYLQARDAYEKALAINPNFSLALNNLAYLYSENLNQQENAYKMAQRARELLPNDPHAADTLGWILYKRRQYGWALGLLRESAAKLPADAEVQFHLGMTSYTAGDEGAASSALKRALQLSPGFQGNREAEDRLAVLAINVASLDDGALAKTENSLVPRTDDPVALERLGSVFEREGSIDKAIAAFQAALQVNPAHVGAMLDLARIYSTHNDTQKALDLAKGARKLEPNDSEVAQALARLAFQTADYQWAASLFEEASVARPNDAGLLYDLALAYYSVGRSADAEAAMHRALEAGIAPPKADDARIFLEMTAIAANPGSPASTATIDSALHSDPAYVPALMAMGRINEQHHDVAAAIQNYSGALAKYPDFYPAARRLVMLYSTSQANDPKALDMAIKAREAYPDDAEVAKASGIVAYRANEYARAETLLQDSARQRGNDAELLYFLGLAQYRLNERVQSGQSLRRALDLNLDADSRAEAQKILLESK
jgi:tetratricopeptide (TPR) repeat protein